MRVQQSRTDVVPTTWEVPVAIASCWVLLALLALPAGQGAACWVTGHGFAWPDEHIPESILGLLTGQTSVGPRQPPVSSVPVSVVYTAITTVELLAFAILLSPCGYLVRVAVSRQLLVPYERLAGGRAS